MKMETLTLWCEPLSSSLPLQFPIRSPQAPPTFKEQDTVLAFHM